MPGTQIVFNVHRVCRESHNDLWNFLFCTLPFRGPRR